MRRTLTSKARVCIVLAILLAAFVLLACTGDGGCSHQNDGSKKAGQCINQ